MDTSPVRPPTFRSMSGRVLVPFLCGLLLMGCSLFDDETSNSGPIRARLIEETIAIQNQGRDTVWTLEAGQRILARLDWRPSVKQEGLPPGQTRTVALREILMDDEEERVVVFWWGARVFDGQREPDKVSSLEVEL